MLNASLCSSGVCEKTRYDINKYEGKRTKKLRRRLIKYPAMFYGLDPKWSAFALSLSVLGFRKLGHVSLSR